MRITEKKALKLIDEKIEQFQAILSNTTYKNCFDQTYEQVCRVTEIILGEILSDEDMNEFRDSLNGGGWIREDEESRLRDYKKEISNYITMLKVYREKIVNFGVAKKSGEESLVPFVSMSFDESDKEINEYFTGILEALKINYETGKKFSKDSIPEKVKRRISSSDLLIAILVKRDEIKDGGYSPPPWIIKEIGQAQGDEKEVIAIVEQGISDTAGLKSEKELIYFERDNAEKMQKATIKFLEALVEHGLISAR